jgi:hypothetical protein
VKVRYTQEAAFVRRRAMTAQKSTLLTLHHEGEIGDETYGDLRADLDGQLLELDAEVEH